MFSTLRTRFSKRAIALFAVMAFALTATGISSLAILTDTVRTNVTASMTTIDLKVNNSDGTAVIPLGMVIPGEVKYASIAFTNSGTGYVKVPVDVPAVAVTPMNTAIKVQKLTAAPENCNATGWAISEASWATAMTVYEKPWTDDRQIDPSTGWNVCLAYKFGNVGETYAGSTLLDLLYTFPGYYP